MILLYKADGAHGQHGAGRVNKHLHKFIFIIMYFAICICLVSFPDTFFLKIFVYGLEHFHSIQGVTGGTDQTSGECSLC